MRSLRLFVTLVVFFGLVEVVGSQQSDAESKLSERVAQGFMKATKDASTYIPASLFAVSTEGDWVTSQVFFRNGFVERNPAFTVDGRSLSTPVSFGKGNLRIAGFASLVFGTSLLNNTVNNVLTETLHKRYPEHPKLIRFISRVEKISFATWLGWHQSHQHFKQWHLNSRYAREAGW